MGRGLLSLGVIALLAAVPLAATVRPPSELPAGLYSLGVGTGDDGLPVAVPVVVPTGPDTGLPSGPAVEPYYAGTRVLRPTAPPVAGVAGPDDVRARALSRAKSQRRWLADGCVPGAGTRWAELSRSALLDLHTLTLPGGALVAGWTPAWRYVWPRDASAGAAALAAAGHVDDASQVLAFLGTRQQPDGLFQARYLPDRPGVPDDRGIQLDSTGWALWGLAEVVERAPAAERADLVARHRTLLDRSATALAALTGDGTRLPPPSPDYWEIHETEVTLGTVAPMLAGMSAARWLYAVAGEGDRAGAADMVHRRFADLVADRFGGRGYQRYPGGGGADSAVAMLMPPFQEDATAAVRAAFEDAPSRLARPAGGIAPGEAWAEKTVSWTPEVALFALAAAASGDTERAERRLGWLQRHRSPLGALPEKVLADGRPAGVAPLAWTAASVVLTVAALDGGTAGCASSDRD